MTVSVHNTAAMQSVGSGSAAGPGTGTFNCIVIRNKTRLVKEHLTVLHKLSKVGVICGKFLASNTCAAVLGEKIQDTSFYGSFGERVWPATYEYVQGALLSFLIEN